MRVGFRKTVAGRPKGGADDDCVIRAFAAHQGWTYAHAKHVINGMADTPVESNGLPLDRVGQFAETLGLLEVKLPCDIPMVAVVERLGDCILFLPSDPPHVVAAINGVVHDTWDSRFIEGTDILIPARTAWISPHPIQRRKK